MDTNTTNLSNKETTRTLHVADLVEKFDKARLSADCSRSRQPKTVSTFEGTKGLESGLGPNSTTTVTTTTTTVREPITSKGDFLISGVQVTGFFTAPSYEYNAAPAASSLSSSGGSSVESMGLFAESPAHKAALSSSFGSSYKVAAPSASVPSCKSGTTNRSYVSGDFKESSSATNRANLRATERAVLKLDHIKTERKEGEAQSAVAVSEMADEAAIQSEEKIGEAEEAVRDSAMLAAERTEVKWKQTKEVASEAAVTIGDKLSTAVTVVKEDAIYARDYVAETAVAVAENLSHKAEYAKEVVIGVKDAAAHATAENLRWAAEKIDPLSKEQSDYVHSVDKSEMTSQPGGMARSITAQINSFDEREYSSKTQ